MRTNAHMTVFNRYVQANDEKYQATQIRNVSWENQTAVNVIQAGLLTADTATVYIPIARGSGSKNYAAPKAWNKLDVKVGYFTFQEGDIIVKGLIDETIGLGFTISDLKKKYDDVLQITNVHTMDLGSAALQHWQIGAK